MDPIRITLIIIALLGAARPNDNLTEYTDQPCEYLLWGNSKTYFESRLIAVSPNFIHFSIQFNVTPNFTSPTAFHPLNWVWTYTSPTANYPFLSWNIDYGLLSFGLLDVKTFTVPYVQINVSDSCQVNLGTNETTWKIVQTLEQVLENMSDEGYHKYEESFFCYLDVAHEIKDTLQYTAALYLNLPITYINYRCCRLHYEYQDEKYNQNCYKHPHEKWQQSLLGPYILGLLLFIYFPIMLFNISAWLAQSEVIERHEFEAKDGYENLDGGDKENWMYLDGKPPITLFESLNPFGGLTHTFPVIISRVRRLFCVLIIPFVIYIQIGMYSKGIGPEKEIKVEELVSHGTPMGFLSLLGKKEDRNKVFAPMFGGPMCILIMYYALGVVFLVFPKSLKQIVELGMPHGHTASPLFLSWNDIIKFSMLIDSPDPGYEKGSVVCKCSIYMLFSKLFWKRVFSIQRDRMSVTNACNSRTTFIAKLLFLPIYIVLCVLEIIVCVIFYGIPIFGFVSIMVKGAVKSMLMFRLQNRLTVMIFGNPFTIFIGTIVVFTMFVFFCYSTCLIFLQSFYFISQIIIFCFVAVIVYPSSSFGYLFFFLVLLYYLVRLIMDFGEIYLELLSVAIEKSHELYGQVNHVNIFDGQVLLYNIVATRLRGIRINDILLDVPQNVLQRMQSDDVSRKISKHSNMYGIPRNLFYYLVCKHRPVHIQVLKIFFHLSLILFLVAMTLSITSKFATGASSEISDVMHVIFIVTVGALPRVLEVFLMNASETVRREIEIRNIEESIKEYWLLKADGEFVIIEP